MPTVQKTSLAERELRDIFLFIGHEERSPAGALRLADAFDQAFTLYAANPLLGAARPELGENFRVFSCGTKSNPHGWVVIYRPTTEGIQVLRVFRSGQNYTELFE